MAVDHIRYDILAQEALRGVVRTVLEDAAQSGLPGDHHFYITVDTCHEGVTLSPRMRAQYPKEITIVLQHQFWDLIVTADRFEVGLSFGGVAERLGVPLLAIKGFADPSVQFALQFEQVEEVADTAAEASTPPMSTPPMSTPHMSTPHMSTPHMSTPPVPSGEPKPARPPAEHTNKRTTPAIAAVPANPPPSGTGKDPDKPSGGGEVVRFDRFRKK